MTKTVKATFDGKVLRPEEPLDLEPNTHCVITIETEGKEAAAGDAWSVLEGLIGSVDAPADWSEEHDHYLYGTPKRRSKKH